MSKHEILTELWASGVGAGCFGLGESNDRQGVSVRLAYHENASSFLVLHKATNQSWSIELRCVKYEMGIRYQLNISIGFKRLKAPAIIYNIDISHVCTPQ